MESPLFRPTVLTLAGGAAIVRTSLHCGEQWLAVEAEAPALDKSGNINVQTIGSAWTYSAPVYPASPLRPRK